jgi:hypothetical protein
VYLSHLIVPDPFLMISDVGLPHRVVELSGLQRPRDLVGVDDDAGRQSFRAIELECAWRSSLCKEALSFAQQDWIDEQQDLIRKPVFERTSRSSSRSFIL